MNRLLLGGAVAAAAAVIATPTAIGLIGNTSFSRDIQVPVPSGAHHIESSDLDPPSEPTPSRNDDGGSGPGSSAVEDRPGRDVASSGATDDHRGGRTVGDNSGPDRGPGGGSADSRGGESRSGHDGGRDG